MEGRSCGSFVWGVNDATHEIVGTSFDQNRDVKNEPLKHFLARQLAPDINFLFAEDYIEGKKVVILKIPAAKTVPTALGKERFIRIGSSKENLRKYPEKESYLLPNRIKKRAWHAFLHLFKTVFINNDCLFS